MKKIFFPLFLCFLFFAFSSEAETNAVLQGEDTTIYNRVWVLTRLNNRKVNYKEGEEKISLIITSENEYARGYLGCNSYTGQAIIKRNRIMFRELETTLISCPGEREQTERIYMNNLDDVDSWAIIDEDLYLYKNSRPILIYTKD
ncbi:MAG: META domain-containing protein [Bacteroidales bacterium]|nr:META domain-containing protein [Bacteroidales bacterium]